MTTFDKISVTALEAKVREIAAAHPDHVYRPGEDAFVLVSGAGAPPEVFSAQCEYVNSDDTPGCIFGHAFMALGVSVDALKSVNTEGIRGILGWGSSCSPEFPIVNWCIEVQNNQDKGETWSLAVAHADEKLGRVAS